MVDKKEDLSGLPETLIAAAATTAKEAGLDGKWVFTLHNPSVMPFLQYADNRALREKIYKAYVCRGNNNNCKRQQGCNQEVGCRPFGKSQIYWAMKTLPHTCWKKTWRRMKRMYTIC